MTTTGIEHVPAIWDDARDTRFFRITAGLFTPEFCRGASILLAGYDDDTTDTVEHTPAPHGTSRTAPADVVDRTRPERDLVPVRVRRTR